jgi:hypothetical protein
VIERHYFLRGHGGDSGLRIEADPDFGNKIPVTPTPGQGGVGLFWLTQRYLLSWPRHPKASSYCLHGSISPMRQENLLKADITEPHTTWIPPVFTPVIEYYFWVRATLLDGSQIWLTETPTSLATEAMARAWDPKSNPLSASEAIPDPEGLNAEMARDLAFIRGGNNFELENGGEPGMLFQRRFGDDLPFGIPCECTGESTETQSPSYQGRGNCMFCFGTGVFGGYYPGVPIRFRYANNPKQVYTRTKSGYVVEHAFNSQMIWAPQIRKGDVIVRLYDGTRFVVDNRNETSFRTVRLHQEFNLSQVGANSPLNFITDKRIGMALDQAGMPGYVRDGFRIFG